MRLLLILFLSLLGFFVEGTARAEPASPVGIWQTIDDVSGEVKSLVRFAL